MQELQKTLALRNEDTVQIEAKVTAKIKSYQQNLQAYEQEFKEVLLQKYPLSESKHSQLQQLAQQMELTDADITSIEARITAQVEEYRRNLEKYRKIFSVAVRQEYPISSDKRSELKSQQQNLGLTDVDIASVEAQITTEIETYQQKLQQYEQAFVDATECKHYPSESTRKKLRQTWQTLELSEADVAKLEAQIKAQIDKYQANLRHYEQEFADAIKQQYPLSEAKRHELSKAQRALSLSEENVAPIETRLKNELEERLKKLQQYKQALASAMEYEDPLRNETREELRELQKVLELNNEDVVLIEEQINASKETENQKQSLRLRSEDIKPIEQPILAAKYQEKVKAERLKREEEGPRQKQQKNITSQSPPRQAVILSSKKARRIVLLGSTALGLVLIFSTFQSNNGLLFVLGNSIILILSVVLAFKRIQKGMTSKRRNIMACLSMLAISIIIIYLSPLSDCENYAVKTTWLSLCELREQQPYILGLTIYLTSIFIGCW